MFFQNEGGTLNLWLSSNLKRLWKVEPMTPDSKPLSGTESVDSSRRQTREGADALPRSIGESEDNEALTGAKSREAASKIAEVAKEAARSTYDAVSAQASELTSNVAGELETSAADQKRRGAETMRAFASAVQHAAGELDHESPVVARQFRTAAQKVEELSEGLRDRSVRDLVSDVSEFARRQPLWFFGGAIIAGFALSRFLKSSAAAPPSADRSEQ
jgi:hypothetical protein